MRAFFASLLDRRWAVVDVLNWRLVRAFGALTVLTRASYGMLVLVPLMAGIWQPIVHWVFDPGSQALARYADVTRSAERLSGELRTQLEIAEKIVSAANKDSAAESEPFRERQRLADLLKENSTLADQAQTLSKKLNRLASSLPRDMPSAWAFAFFAALAVALGQFVYQTSAPEIIRRHTLEEYQEAKTNPSGRAPTSDEINSAVLLIRDAEFNKGTVLNRKIVPCLEAVFKCVRIFESKLHELYAWDRDDTSYGRRILTQEEMKAAADSDRVQTAIHETRRFLAGEGIFYARECLELVQDEGLFERSLDAVGPMTLIVIGDGPSRILDDRPRHFETTEYLAGHHLSPPFKVADNAEKIAYNRERVWIGASVEYSDQSRLRARVRCFVSIMFYGTASLLIAWITYTQAKSVAQAVGWLPSQ